MRVATAIPVSIVHFANDPEHLDKRRWALDETSIPLTLLLPYCAWPSPPVRAVETSKDDPFRVVP